MYKHSSDLILTTATRSTWVSSSCVYPLQSVLHAVDSLIACLSWFIHISTHIAEVLHLLPITSFIQIDLAPGLSYQPGLFPKCLSDFMPKPLSSTSACHFCSTQRLNIFVPHIRWPGANFGLQQDWRMGKRGVQDQVCRLGSKQLHRSCQQPWQVLLVSWPSVEECSRVSAKQWHQWQLSCARKWEQSRSKVDFCSLRRTSLPLQDKRRFRQHGMA